MKKIILIFIILSILVVSALAFTSTDTQQENTPLPQTLQPATTPETEPDFTQPAIIESVPTFTIEGMPSCPAPNLEDVPPEILNQTG